LTLTDNKHQMTKCIIKSSINYLKIQLIINSEFHEFNELLKDLFRQKLNKLIDNHLLTEYKVYLNLIVLMQIIDVVIKDIDVL